MIRLPGSTGPSLASQHEAAVNDAKKYGCH